VTKNTSFFHRSTVVRRARNLIIELKNGRGKTVKGREAISALLFHYFKERWNVDNSVSWHGDLSCITEEISAEQNDTICREVTEEEIVSVIKAMPLDKAPGPDGIPAEFYIKCWTTVRFIAAIKHFFSLGSPSPSMEGYLPSLSS